MHRERTVLRVLASSAILLAASFTALVADVISGPTLTMDPNGTTPLAGVVEMETDVSVLVRLTVTDGLDLWEVSFPEPATVHYLPVLGLKPDRSYIVDVTIDPGGFVGSLPAVTGPLPTDFPVVQIEVSEPGLMEPGFTLLDCFRRADARPRYSIIVNSAGEVVWYSTICGAVNQLTINGNLSFRSGPTAHETDLLGNSMVNRPLDVPGAGLHHEFLRTPMGTYLSLDKESVLIPDFPTSETDPDAPTADATVADQPVVEFFPDGTLRNKWLFSEMVDTTRIGYDSLNNSAQGYDWVHSNAVIYDPRDDTLIASLRSQDAVVKFSRQTGELVWILAPHANWSPEFQPFLLHQIGAPFRWSYHQHAPMLTEDGTLVLFDNGNSRASPFDGNPRMPASESFSRAVEYQIDEGAMEIQQVWEYGENIAEPIYTSVQGDADWLPQTGNVLITFSAVQYTGGIPSPTLGLGERHARIIEVTDDIIPEPVFDLLLFDTTGGRIQVYRSERIPGLYPQEYVKGPNGVGNTLRAGPSSNPVQLSWSAPPVDALHSAATFYVVYASNSPDAGFSIVESTNHASTTVVSTADLVFYKIVAGNVAGGSTDYPAP